LALNISETGSNKSKMAATAMLKKFQVAISPQPVVRSTSCFVQREVFGDGASNGAIFSSNKSKMAAAAGFMGASIDRSVIDRSIDDRSIDQSIYF